MATFNRSNVSSYWRSIVTMALSCIVSKKKRDIGGKSQSVHTPPVIDALLGFPSEYCHKVWHGKTTIVGLSDGDKTFESVRICFFVLIQCTNVTAGQTDGQTDTAREHRPRYE